MESPRPSRPVRQAERPASSIPDEYGTAFDKGYADGMRSGHASVPGGYNELERAAYMQGWREAMGRIVQWEDMPLPALESEYERGALTPDERETLEDIMADLWREGEGDPARTWREPESGPDDGRFRVLMVCTGNTSRSAIAHAAGRAAAPPGVVVGSAGTDAWGGSRASDKAATAAAELGIDLSGHRSRELTPAMLKAADEVWCMTDRHMSEIAASAPWAIPKLRRLDPNADIADPHGGSVELYGETAERVVRAVRTRMAALRLERARAASRPSAGILSLIAAAVREYGDENLSGGNDFYRTFEEAARPARGAPAPADSEEYYMTEACPHFALALNELFGYPLRMLVDEGIEEDGYPTVAHVYAIDLEGNAADIKGHRPESEVRSEFWDMVEPTVYDVSPSELRREWMGDDKPLHPASESELEEAKATILSQPAHDTPWPRRGAAYHRVSAMLDVLYHGTFRDIGLAPGGRLAPRYEGWEHLDGEVAEMEEALDRFRPPGAVARDACVYMVAEPSDALDVNPGYDVIYAVRPDPPVQASDLGWYGAFDRKWSEAAYEAAPDRDQDDIDAVFAGMRPSDEAELRRLAEGYWGGNPYDGGWLTEYRAPSATVLKEVE